jgi:hypothetical protein
MAKAVIKIELHYDLKNHYGTDVYEQMESSEILTDLENNVYEDLIDLMRGDSVRYWAGIEIEKENA